MADHDKVLANLEAQLEPLSSADMDQGGILWGIVDSYDNPDLYTLEQVDALFKAAAIYAERWEARYGHLIDSDRDG